MLNMIAVPFYFPQLCIV